jgi:hypothetical protein
MIWLAVLRPRPQPQATGLEATGLDATDHPTADNPIRTQVIVVGDDGGTHSLAVDSITEQGPCGRWYLKGGPTTLAAIQKCADSHRERGAKLRQNVGTQRIKNTEIDLVLWYNTLHSFGGYEKVIPCCSMIM